MANAQGLLIGAGGLAFAGNFKESGGFPENGVAIVGATTALVFLASTIEGTPLARPVKALAALMLLAAVYRYIPGLMKKDKKNG